MTHATTTPPTTKNLIDGGEICRGRAAGELRLGVAGQGDLRWAVVDLGSPLEDARQRLDLSPIAAVALGRALAAAALLLRFTTKGSSHIVLEVRGDGPLGKITAEVNALGYVRGLVGAPRLETPDGGGMRLADAVGRGTLQITWWNPRGERYQSQVELVSGEIGKDLVHFLHQSQQIRSAALLGVLPKPTGIAEAGGLIVEALPGVREKYLTVLEKNIASFDGVSTSLEKGGAQQLLDDALVGLDRDDLESHELHYGCGQGRDNLVEKLQHLTPEDVAAIVDESGCFTAECAYCARKFTLTNDELLQGPDGQPPKTH